MNEWAALLSLRNAASIINKFLFCAVFPFSFQLLFSLDTWPWLNDCWSWRQNLWKHCSDTPIHHCHNVFCETITWKKKKQKTKHTHSALPRFTRRPGDARRVSPCVSLHSRVFLPLMLCPQAAPLTPPPPPPTSARRSLLASMWHGWHRYGQLECEGVRLMCSSACGSGVLLSFFISSRCVTSKAVPSLVFAAFLRWLFSTCCWSCRPSPPPHTCQSELRITHRVRAVAAVNRATSWLPGCDTARVGDLIYSGSSPCCMLSVRTEHDMSQRLAGKIWRKKKTKTKCSCNSKRCVTFNLGWN